jgi:methyl-accepting chemotaxis protein
MDEIQRLCDEMKESSEDAEQAAMLELRAKDSAKQGFQALSDVQATLSSFVASSNEIDRLLEEIQLLTQQVHMLGVNAAIEAANAGKHGSGFSIIAIEMRRIAGLVKGTAGKTQEILENSGSLANDTVVAIEQASETLELLEVSADLSIDLTNKVAKRAKDQFKALERMTSKNG